MASQIVSYGTAPSQVRSLADQLSAKGPEVARVHLDVPFKTPSAHGVTFRRRGRRPEDLALAVIYEATAKEPPVFIVAIRSGVDDPTQFVLTLAHELEHVRQDLACPRILELSNLARDFVQERYAAFPEYPTELDVPVNAHAEAKAIACAKDLLSESQLMRHYADKSGSLERLAKVDPASAAADLATFFQVHWERFEDWYNESVRPTKPPLDEVRTFVDSHA